jgi:hypothetical protein
MTKETYERLMNEIKESTEQEGIHFSIDETTPMSLILRAMADEYHRLEKRIEALEKTFKTDDDVRKFHDEMQDSTKDDFEKLDSAKRQSEKLAREKIVG